MAIGFFDKQFLYQCGVGRYLFRQVYTTSALVSLLFKKHFYAFSYCCRVKRILENNDGLRIADQIYHDLLDTYIKEDGELRAISQNPLLREFTKLPVSQKIRKHFLMYDERHRVSMKEPADNDNPERQGNLIILKAYDEERNEKGALYLQYSGSFQIMAALFDLSVIAQRYVLIFEPSTWGYYYSSFSLFIGYPLDVLVLAQDEKDYNIIENMNSNLIPLRLGAGDWIDPNRFKPAEGVSEKCFDVVMVASWLKLKRHTLLFKTLRDSNLSEIRVALVGYPWEGRTRKDIENEARRYGVLDQIRIFESIPQSEVASVLCKSKVAVMLTEREGANRGIYEALFCDVPVILYKYNRGVNKDIINEQTGVLSTDEELGSAIRYMVKHFKDFKPREWALRNSGFRNAWEMLNSAFLKLEYARTGKRVYNLCMIKSNPNLVYADDQDRVKMESEYYNLVFCLTSCIR